MVDLNTALGEQLLDVAVGQVVTQIPADCDRNHLTREPVSRWRERGRCRAEHRVSVHGARRDQPTQQTPPDRSRALKAGLQADRGRPAGWRAVNASHLVALVRAGARFERGKLVEREVSTAVEEAA
jgi:hypothetical protein